MDFTPGEIFFYAGAAGMAITLIASLITAFVTKRGLKRLRRAFDEEYGRGF